MTPLVTNVTNFLSYIIVILDVFAVCLFFILITPLRKRGWTKQVAEFFGERAIFFGFLVALASVGGSLFYSSVALFQPCLLCWWQRIFLYPQAILLLIALIKKDRLVRIHAIVLSSIGALISIYHTFIQFGGTPLGDCGLTGVSCEHVYFVQYGYVTIPTMALTAFVLILLFMFSPNPKNRQVNEI